MEVFLLLIVILLLVIFNASKNARLKILEQKLSNVENYLKSIQLGQQKAAAQKTETAAEKPVVPPVIPPVVPKTEQQPVIIPEKQVPPPVKEPLKQPMLQPLQNPVKTAPIQQQQSAKPAILQEGWYERFRKNNPDLEKFIGENILSKIAIVILVLGIAFFVKYAIDKEWINEVARVGIGLLCGGIVLGFAHRLHNRFKAFSSVLVAGGISIFYFTVGIAFHQYHIFNQAAAFTIMLCITGFSVFISIAYDRIELAALSLVGGFATPFIASNGGGNYQVLFIYILILDLGMLVLAYLRKWNLINILAYAFTMLLYFSWLESRVMPAPQAPYRGALVFGAIFYVVFVLMNIINNIKEKRKFGTIELSILISNTFLFYGAGMQILSAWHPEAKGAFSIGMALFNLICAWLLYKKFKADSRLVYLMIGLTLTFITLVAPVQLKGNYITMFWSLEAVLLVWLAQRSGIVLYRFASVLITLLMLLGLLLDWISVYNRQYHELPVAIMLNKAFITGALASLCLLAMALLFKKEQDKTSYLGIEFYPQAYGRVLQIGFVILLYLTGFLELLYQLNMRWDSRLATGITLQSYHLLFMCVLNIALAKPVHKASQSALYILNFISCAIFVLFFALMPVFDFKENIVTTQAHYTGFIFHYLNLGAVLFITYKMRRMLHTEPPLKIDPALNTVLTSIAIVYLCSIELVLHVLQFNIVPVSSTATPLLIAKLDEYDTTVMHVVKIGFPVLWGLLAFAFLTAGMRKQNKTLRVLALALIALILLKLFTYDIQNASEAGKIIAFILLGVVLLVISFMYQKIKALLLDDTKKQTPDNNPGKP